MSRVLPTASGAAVVTVAGLNRDDPILVDATDGNAHAATVVSIDAAAHWVTWTPALPPGMVPLSGGFIQSATELTFPAQSATDAAGRIYTIDTSNDRDDRDDDDDHDWDGGAAELQTYSFTDAFVPASGPAPIQSPSRVTLVEKVRQSGNEVRVHVMSYQYLQGAVAGPVISPGFAYKTYGWDTNSDGSLKSLTQKFQLHDGGRHNTEVMATFDARRNTTRISVSGPHVEYDDHDRRSDRDVDNDDDRTVPGLILLRMTTRSGSLKIEYDVHSPVPVPDLAPPVLTMPSSLTVEATGPSGAVVTFATSAFDAVDHIRPVICTADSGSVFPLGSTTVTCSATDDSGNKTPGTFKVTVKDSVAPVLTLPATITVTTSSTSGANVSYTATAADAVSGSRSVSCSPSSGSKFKVGTTSVSCSASDSTGNTATGSFNVTVNKN